MYPEKIIVIALRTLNTVLEAGISILKKRCPYCESYNTSKYRKTLHGIEYACNNCNKIF